jgi:hypothetical protein
MRDRPRRWQSLRGVERIPNRKFLIPNCSFHAAPLAIFAALTLAWTWPLAPHLFDAIPGDPGDNYSFLWNLWWMRHVRATTGLEFFRTNFLFYPSGTTIADHPHTALPAFFAATALSRLSIIAAQNVLVLIDVFANMACMYWLAWSITRHRRASILAGVIFGTSPYFSVHLLGHFDLMAGWLLPLFVMLFLRAVEHRSRRAAIGAGLVLAATTYTVYYYVVYVVLFVAAYLLAVSPFGRIAWIRRVPTKRLSAARNASIAIAVLACVIAGWTALTGGTTLYVRDRIVLTVHQPQNPLTLMWLGLIAAALCTWRPMRSTAAGGSHVRLAESIRTIGWIFVIFVAAAAPLILEAIHLVRAGEYVTPVYFWRSAPRGVDVSAPFVGHPRHPLMRYVAQRAYRAMEVDYIETVGWIGIAPILLLAIRRRGHRSPDARNWWLIAAVFCLWAAGPFLTVAGINTGLWLPEILARYVPFVANARVPGRAMIGVYMCIALLVAIRLSQSSGRLGSPALQWLLVVIAAFEYFDGPVPLTRLDDPATYHVLAAAPPGAVCEVPFGIGDGLGGGAGWQDRRMLYYATIHEHPVAGGFIGRMPADTERRYRAFPTTSVLLRLSSPVDTSALTAVDTSGSPGAPTEPCDYFVVNREVASARLQSYVRSLPVKLLARDAIRDVFQVIR